MDAKHGAWGLIFAVLLARPGVAEEGPSGAFSPSEDAYAAAEAERLAAVQRQVQLNDLMRWRAGLPPANGVFYAPFPLPFPGKGYYAGGFGWNGWSEAVFFPYGAIAPGGAGYRYLPRMRQPIGRVEIQTGPNRWESHPVYAAPPAPAEPPEVMEESLPPLPSGKAPRRGGPREF